MRRRLFLNITIIVFAGFFCFFGLTVYISHENHLNQAKDTVKEVAYICAGLLTDETDFSSFVKVGGDTRITIVSPDGTVLADSRPVNVGSIENHLNRPEIQAAANGAPEAYIRYSDTLGVDLIYYALKVNNDESYVFIRTAIPVATIDAYFNQSLPLLIFSLLIVILFCFFFIRNVTNRILKPFYSIEQKLRLLSSGEYKTEPITGSFEEINKITKEIDDIAFVLQNSINSLHRERSKQDYILNNIGDGLLVVNENKSIELINASALEIFNVKPDIAGKNINYLTYDQLLIEAVEDNIKNDKNVLFEIARNGRIFFTSIKKLPDTELTILTFTDVTENLESAKRREEFFANASHELKTPLTAIKGLNELTMLNNNDESIDKYINSITRETDRMLLLIDDMLKLSELETKQNINPEPVSLLKVVNEVREALSALIDKKAISFEITGNAIVNAETGHIYELVKNLAENALRYNNQDGHVTVTIEKENTNVRLIVADDGIGISPDEQTRIFERFYRVEKSRSQQRGGTGLGLSIVKHICALYDWKLSLKSRLGVGTEITIVFAEKK